MPEDHFHVLHSQLVQAEKGKGCSALIAFEGAQNAVPMFMGGVGVASLSNDRTNPPVSLSDAVPHGTTSMEWVSNRFSAKSDILGDVTVTFQTANNSTTRSLLVLIPESQLSLLPAQMVNILYFEMNMPAKGITLFNKDPLILQSRSTNISADTFKNDPRVARDPSAIPARLRDIAAGLAFSEFTPVGNHQQMKPVALYDKANPERRVATLSESKVFVVPHYGLEIKLVASERIGDEIFADIDLSNLTQTSQEVVWFVEAIHNLEVTTQQLGHVQLGSRGDQNSAVRLRVAARKKEDGVALGQLDYVIVAASNTTAQSINDFISDCIVLTTG